MVEMVVSLTARSWQRMCVFFFSFSLSAKFMIPSMGVLFALQFLFDLASCPQL